MVPELHQYKTWEKVFDIAEDGVSYDTLFYKARGWSPSVLVVEDMKGNVFGVYASQEWKESKEFYGTGESFVFSFKVVLEHILEYPICESIQMVKEE